MAESKGAFRRRLGRLLTILTEATTTADGDTSTIICDDLADFFTSDDTLDGSAIYDVDAEEWRVVDSWIAATATATMLRAFSNSMVAGRDIEVYEQFTPRDLDNALKMALDEAYSYIVIKLVDESNVVEADTYEYPVPDVFRDFSRMAGCKVTWSPNEDIETYPRVEIPDWTTRYNGESMVLVLPTIQGLIGKTLRLEGPGVPGFPSSDGSLLPFRSDTLQLLAFKAAEVAWRTGPGLSGKDAEFAQNQEIKWATKFEEKRDAWGTDLYPTRFPDANNVPAVDYPLVYFHREPS